MRLARSWFIVTAAATASAILALAPATRADARPAASPAGVAASRACPPAGFAVSFSDSLDKLVYHGVALGGLSVAPAKDVVSKKLVANLVACPTLGAPSRETQANPLLDNYEGMTITSGPGLAGVSLISDDNFSATQFTRVLNLLVKLP
jgi:hypothetical protein